MSDWNFKKLGQTPDKWPKDEKGEPEQPVFLEHIVGMQIDVDMELSLLKSFDIPVFYTYPNNGEFGKLILGFAGTGVDIYVPESMLEDARNILSSAPADDELLEESDG